MNIDIRLSVEFWQHPKTFRLEKKLGLKGIRSLQILWCWCAKNRPDGDLTDFNEQEIEFAADWRGKRGAFIEACRDDWIDEDEDGYRLHEWHYYNPWQAQAVERDEKRKEKSRALSERVKKGADARWGKTRREQPENDETIGDATSNANDMLKHDASICSSNANDMLKHNSGNATSNAQAMPLPVPYPNPCFKNFKDTNVSLSSPSAPDASNPSFLNLPEMTASKPPSALASYFNRLPGNDPESSADPEGEFDEPRGEYEPPNKANIPKPDGKSAIPPCPHKRIIAAYHEELPELPQVKVWEGARAKRLAARWKERCLAGKYQSLEDGLAYWRRLFRHIRANCPFLMGRVETRDGRAFYADLAWLTKPENFAKLIEGKYDKKAVAA